MKKVLALAFSLVSAACLAQDTYPSRPIRIINPFPAGGAADVIARSIGEQLTLKLKQPVVVDNRTGAGGRIGDAAQRKNADLEGSLTSGEH